MNFFKKILLFIIEIFERFIMIGSDEKSAIISIDNYPELKVLEDNYKVILQEYLAYTNTDNNIPFMDNLSIAQKRIVEIKKWQATFLMIYGKVLPNSISHFKNTHQLISKINGIKTVFFSVFLPQAHLQPHRGPYKGILRYHLGLIIPKDELKCSLFIDHKELHWKAGNAFMFDDTYMHEATNFSNESRVVLFIDVKRKLKFPYNYMNDFFLFLIRYSPFVNEIFTNAKR